MNLYYEMTTVYGVELTEEEAEMVRQLAEDEGLELDEAAGELVLNGRIDPWNGREKWIFDESNNGHFCVYDD